MLINRDRLSQRRPTEDAARKEQNDGHDENKSRRLRAGSIPTYLPIARRLSPYWNNEFKMQRNAKQPLPIPSW